MILHTPHFISSSYDDEMRMSAIDRRPSTTAPRHKYNRGRGEVWQGVITIAAMIRLRNWWGTPPADDGDDNANDETTTQQQYLATRSWQRMISMILQQYTTTQIGHKRMKVQQPTGAMWCIACRDNLQFHAIVHQQQVWYGDCSTK
jgi:hypothetical protein